jgi:pyridoxal phosphate enzyme (YggS family)
MIAESVEKIRERIERACLRSGRKAADVTLLAVAKTFPPERIAEAVSCGILDIGENYVQELLGKKEVLRHPEIRWHFIGHLQSNKVKYIAPWVHLIHAVDSTRLAAEINRKAEQAGRTIDILVEINSTGEQSKFGTTPEGAEALVRSMAGFAHLRVLGLMTMGLFLPDPEGSRPLYRMMARLRSELARLDQKNVEMTHLSMGMTGDFEVAIEEGATIVRIGTALFGKRKKG